MHDKVFEKISFKEEYPEHYAAKENEVTLTKTTDFNYISIAGVGHPNLSKEFNKCIQLLEGLIFTMKFKLKRNPPEGFVDFQMPPCETIRRNLDKKPEERIWVVALPLLQFITEEQVVKAWRIAQAKTEDKMPQVEFHTGKKSKSIQILNIGAYNTSEEANKLLQKYAKKNGLTITGEYEELYLNDMRRTKPENLETIIRYKVK